MEELFVAAHSLVADPHALAPVLVDLAVPINGAAPVDAASLSQNALTAGVGAAGA